MNSQVPLKRGSTKLLSAARKRNEAVRHRTLRYRQVSFAGRVDNYAEFVKLMYARAWDIGLAPLADTPSNQRKTNNECREYGACLIPGIYSDMSIYRASVNDRETGLLVPHIEDWWFEGMKTLIDLRDLRGRIAVNARLAAYRCLLGRRSRRLGQILQRKILLRSHKKVPPALGNQ